MKKTGIIMLALLCLLSGCVGVGSNDWRYELPNQYEMWHINANHIEIGLVITNTMTIYKDSNPQNELIGIPANVVEIAYNEQFVCAKTIEPEKTNAYNDGEEVMVSYYILDTRSQKTYGPYVNEIDYDKMVSLLIDDDLIDWERTIPVPENAIFP